MIRHVVICCALSLLAIFSTPTLASPPDTFMLRTIAAGFTRPMSFTYAPDGRIFVAEKGGLIKIVSAGQVLAKPYADLRARVNHFANRGILAIALDPNFASNQLLYVSYLEETAPATPDSNTTSPSRVIRLAPLASDPNQADLASVKTILTGFTASGHEGGDIKFDAAGRMLVTYGDSKGPGLVDASVLATYDLNSFNGKLIRVDRDTGLGVPGNPYYDPANPDAKKSKILARGLRNPFRFNIDPIDGKIYIGDVGWDTWEELNIVPTSWTNADRELNFGWPCYEGGNNVPVVNAAFARDASTRDACAKIYSKAEGGTGVGAGGSGFAWRHETDRPVNFSSAIIGGPRYTGATYPATFVGKYFYADYNIDAFYYYTPGGGATAFGTKSGWGSPVDIKVNPSGNIAYLAIVDGSLKEIVYLGDNHPPVAVAQADRSNGALPLDVRFSSAGSMDPDAEDSLTYNWNFGDGAVSAEPNPVHTFTQAGSYNVRLVVTDSHNIDAVAELHIDAGNTPPTIAFQSPSPDAAYKVGDTIAVSLAANDSEDGTLPGGSVSWEVILHHNDHVHYLLQNSGNTGSFKIADEGDNTWIELRASATDSLGAIARSSVNLSPRRVAMTVTTSPSGGSVVESRDPQLTPYAWQSAIGSAHKFVANRNMTKDGRSYTFASWADGSAMSTSQTFKFVTGSAPRTVTAKYNADTKITLNVVAPRWISTLGKQIYIAGTLNNLSGQHKLWDPAGTPLQQVDPTHWTVTLFGRPNVSVSYKFTLGDWATVEKNSTCNTIADRTFTLGTTDQVKALTLASVGGYSPCVLPSSLSLRASHDNFLPHPMAKNASGEWQLDLPITAAVNLRFKFDVFGDWSVNYGDTELDSIANLGGKDIPITSGAGTYRFTFNPSTKRYAFSKLATP